MLLPRLSLGSPSNDGEIGNHHEENRDLEADEIIVGRREDRGDTRPRLPRSLSGRFTRFITLSSATALIVAANDSASPARSASFISTSDFLF